MTEPLQQTGRANPANRGVRFEATVHPGDRARDLAGVADLDLDRVPDPEGRLRVLVTAPDCVRLLQHGYEVHLVRALPVRPLDPELIDDDESVTRWLEDRVQGIERREER